jgi:RimJ/RimL family protein N-acetyltransferase
MVETTGRTHDTRDLNRRPPPINLRIRPSGPGDRERLLACFQALSPESRRLRFFTAKHTLSPNDLDSFAGADGWDHIALAAIRLDPQGEEQEALGFARCMRLAGGNTAEFAITVIDTAQGQGVGRALLDNLIVSARDAGIRRLRCEVLAENRAMRALAERMGARAHWSDDGTVEYDCALPEPPAEPVWDVPWFADPHGLASACAELWLGVVDDALVRAHTAQEEVAAWLAVLCPGSDGPVFAGTAHPSRVLTV